MPFIHKTGAKYNRIKTIIRVNNMHTVIETTLKTKPNWYPYRNYETIRQNWPNGKISGFFKVFGFRVLFWCHSNDLSGATIEFPSLST